MAGILLEGAMGFNDGMLNFEEFKECNLMDTGSIPILEE